jgi:hypothetical protein
MDRPVSRAKPKPMRRVPEKIMDDIIQVLGNVEDKKLVWKDLILPEGETRVRVRRALDDTAKFFHRWDEWCSRKGRVTIADHARELAGLVAALEAKLNGLPEPLADYLFMPPQARHAVMPVDEIMAITMTDHAMLMQRLERLRLDCERQRFSQGSSGPEQDRAKNHCAMIAFNILRTFSRQPITSTQGGSYRTLASLVYEDFTGEPDIDLKHPCQRVLDSHRR